jgi:hypothetical protein
MLKTSYILVRKTMQTIIIAVSPIAGKQPTEIMKILFRQYFLLLCSNVCLFAVYESSIYYSIECSKLRAASSS